MKLSKNHHTHTHGNMIVKFDTLSTSGYIYMPRPSKYLDIDIWGSTPLIFSTFTNFSRWV